MRVQHWRVLLLGLWVLLATTAGAAEVRYQTVQGAGGVPLQVASTGDPGGPALLFIHGMGQSHFAFHRQFSSDLAQRFHLISFDLRGHGASGKPWKAEDYGSAAIWAGDVAAVLEATGAKQPLIVGWSYGSVIAMDYVRERGADSVAGVLLTGAIGALMPFRVPVEEDPVAAEFLEVRRLQFSPDPNKQVAAIGRMVDWLTNAPLERDERAVMMATATMLPQYARRAIYQRAVDNRDMVEALAATHVLFALGSEDNSILLEDAAALAARHDNIRLSLYDGAGHSVFLEQPERFNDELRAFAREVFGESVAASSGSGGR